MARTYKNKKTTKIKYTKKKPANTKNAIVKLDTRLKLVTKQVKSGVLKPVRFEIQVSRHDMSPRWNRHILIAPDQMYDANELRAWKHVFNTRQSILYQTPKAQFTGLKICQNFRLKSLLAAGTQTFSQPVILHNYIVKCTQDFGSIWKESTNAEYTASFLEQDVHYALLGGNTASNIVANSGMFFLNKKCFTILAQHHHTFGPYGMEQTGSATAVGIMTNINMYEKTYVDYIPLSLTLKAAGDPVIHDNSRGWTGLTYKQISPMDQILIISWSSQGDVGTVGSYTLTHAANGLIYGKC